MPSPHDRGALLFGTILTFFVVVLVVVVAVGAVGIATTTPRDLDSGDYDGPLLDNESTPRGDATVRFVRCYCNQPECVPQGYMCRGQACFTEVPSIVRADGNTHNAYVDHSGCLEEVSPGVRRCPAGFLCCSQDLCNHVDSPAMRHRLNKTLRVLISEQRVGVGVDGSYLDPVRTVDDGVVALTESWFKMATIAVPICGLIVLLILASLAIRLLQPMPTHSDKVGGHAGHRGNRATSCGPPLLGSPKVPLV